nr:MAG TPA: hypothetical protein [Caudoviricetes sp.]
MVKKIICNIFTLQDYCNIKTLQCQEKIFIFLKNVV